MIDRVLISVTAPKEKGKNISMFHNSQDLTGKPEELRKYWEDPETIYQNNMERLENTFLGAKLSPLSSRITEPAGTVIITGLSLLMGTTRSGLTRFGRIYLKQRAVIQKYA
mgnify:CR=1 FL=1